MKRHEGDTLDLMVNWMTLQMLKMIHLLPIIRSRITGRNDPGVLYESPRAFSVLHFTDFATRLSFWTNTKLRQFDVSFLKYESGKEGAI